MANRQREEVLNVKLAECICDRGMAAAPENILMSASQARKLPDVIVSVAGLRCIIEGKIEDAQNARGQVEKDARGRVADGIAHLAVGVVYPSYLRTTAFAELNTAMVGANLDFMVSSEAVHGEWRTGNLDSLMDELRRSYELLVADDVLERSVERLQVGMRRVAAALADYSVAATRLADVLGVYQEGGEADGNE